MAGRLLADDEIQSTTRKGLDSLIKKQRKDASVAAKVGGPFVGWWKSALGFLKHVRRETLVALSPDYESLGRLNEVVRDTKARIEELLKIEPDLPKALQRFSLDQAVRILTIHKSKGLEFDSVIILGVEDQTFWGNPDEERCAFFVGASRAKRRLVLTVCNQREKPPKANHHWQAVRQPHAEFLGYAHQFLSNGK